MITVRVPASSANLGPGFDALGMALTLTADIGLIAAGAEPALSAIEADPHHPATAAFGAAGGVGRLWVRSPIPMARGLGYSGAMRVGGAAVAVAQRCGGDPGAFAEARPEAFTVAARLEGHGDNAAASLFGGLVATDGSAVVPVETPLHPDVVLWIPAATTSTAASRTAMPDSVAFADAVFNVGRVAVLVAAFAAGDAGALRDATDDRLHQDRRFAAAEGSRAALGAGLEAGAWCGWLSGSGPTIALLAEPGHGDRIAAALPPGGRATTVAIDRTGAVLV